MQYRNICDRGRLASLELTNTSSSPQFSDAEMGELLELEEREGLQYLAEVIHKDIVAADIGAAEYLADCFSRVPPKAYWDLESSLQDRVDFSNTSISMSGELSKEDCLKREEHFHQHEKSRQCFQKHGSPVRIKSKVKTIKMEQRKWKEINVRKRVSQHMLYTAQALKGVPEAKSAEAPIEISKVKQVPSNVLPSIHKQNNDKAKASAASFPCDSKSSSDADQKVFLGGLPIGMKEKTLREQMCALGYKVLKRPKILRGFAPEVWMRSVEQAQELVARGSITLEGVKVEVRPYNSLAKLSELKKIPNVGKRSIFLGGLPNGTTAKDIKEVVMNMGMKVLNSPVVKNGFSRQVILENVPQAKTLIKMKKILLNGKLVDVRPFVNHFRKCRIQ